MPAIRLFSFASCIHIGITSFKNFSLAAFSVEMSKPIYCWAFCLVEISGNGTSSEYPCRIRTLAIAMRALYALSSPCPKIRMVSCGAWKEAP